MKNHIQRRLEIVFVTNYIKFMLFRIINHEKSHIIKGKGYICSNHEKSHIIKGKGYICSNLKITTH
ncbi:hypothetical protein DW079_07730, partial [Segatella copri]